MMPGRSYRGVLYLAFGGLVSILAYRYTDLSVQHVGAVGAVAWLACPTCASLLRWWRWRAARRYYRSARRDTA